MTLSPSLVSPVEAALCRPLELSPKLLSQADCALWVPADSLRRSIRDTHGTCHPERVPFAREGSAFHHDDNGFLCSPVVCLHRHGLIPLKKLSSRGAQRRVIPLPQSVPDAGPHYQTEGRVILRTDAPCRSEGSQPLRLVSHLPGRRFRNLQLTTENLKLLPLR